MNILFASRKPLYPAGAGGGEVSVHQLFAAVKELGHEATALGSFDLEKVADIARALKNAGIVAQLTERRAQAEVGGEVRWDYPESVAIDYFAGNYPIKMVLPGEYDAELKGHIERHRPDWILVQADYWYESYETIKEIDDRPKVALYLRNGKEFDYRDAPVVGFPEDIPDAVIANSAYIARAVEKKHGIAAHVVHPGFDLSEYEIREGSSDRGYVTFINPVREKGVETFLRVAMSMPQVAFLCVEGWGTPESVRRFLEKLPNVTYLPRQESMSKVYARSRVVIIPSLWEEAFGRVAVEAQAAGCVVVASRRGGLEEAVGDGGVLVDRYGDSDVWREELSRLLADEERCEKLIRAGKARCKRFSSEEAAKKLLTVLKKPTR